MKPLRLAIAALALAATACHQITIKSGRDVSPLQPRVEDKRFHSILGDLVLVDKPVDLAWACPNGWAEIHTEVGVLDWLLAVWAAGIYQAHTVTVRCAPG